jgi:hypothetical protein
MSSACLSYILNFSPTALLPNPPDPTVLGSNVKPRVLQDRKLTRFAAFVPKIEFIVLKLIGLKAFVFVLCFQELCFLSLKNFVFSSKNPGKQKSFCFVLCHYQMYCFA